MVDQTKSRVIGKNRLTELLDKIARDYCLIAPVRDNNVTFGRVESGNEVTLDYINTVLSPKNAFFPQTETLFRFSRDDSRRLGIEQDGEVVAHAASEHEEMPDHVTIRKPLPAVEDHTQGVGQTAGADEDQGLAGHPQPKLPARENDQPSHGEIEDQ